MSLYLNMYISLMTLQKLEAYLWYWVSSEHKSVVFKRCLKVLSEFRKCILWITNKNMFNIRWWKKISFTAVSLIIFYNNTFQWKIWKHFITCWKNCFVLFSFCGIVDFWCAKGLGMPNSFSSIMNQLLYKFLLNMFKIYKVSDLKGNKLGSIVVLLIYTWYSNVLKFNNKVGLKKLHWKFTERHKTCQCSLGLYGKNSVYFILPFTFSFNFIQEIISFVVQFNKCCVFEKSLGHFNCFNYFF